MLKLWIINQNSGKGIILRVLKMAFSLDEADDDANTSIMFVQIDRECSVLTEFRHRICQLSQRDD